MLAAIASSTTNTVRIVTFRDRQNAIHIHATILRLGRAGNAADNWDRGGLSVAIDPETGKPGVGVLKPKYGGERMETHPDSGVRFAGQIIPHWPEVRELCIHAARVTPNLRSIVWDVVVTAEGPRHHRRQSGLGPDDGAGAHGRFPPNGHTRAARGVRPAFLGGASAAARLRRMATKACSAESALAPIPSGCPSRLSCGNLRKAPSSGTRGASGADVAWLRAARSRGRRRPRRSASTV